MSTVGAWMQIVALGILVVQIAEREGSPERAPLYLGLMGMARAVPGLAFTLVAGAVADRVDRRRLLLVTQSVMALNAGALAVLTFLGVASLWNVLVAATVQSAAFAFDNPSRQSMVPRIVPLPVLPSAIGLQSAAFNGASFVGPMLAGVLYVPLGVAGLLAANALSFAAMITALRALPPIPPVRAPEHSIIGSLREGARYLRDEPVLVWTLVIAGTLFTTAGPASALFPAVAGEATWNGMSWLSLLLAATGLGAFTASLAVMNVGRIRALGAVFVGAAVLNSLMLVLFALAAQPVLALALAYLTGLGGTLMAGMGNNMLQATTHDAYRGRVMSVWAITFIGVMPLGQLALGALGSLLGIHAALVIGGVVGLAAALYAVVRLRVLREWRAPVRDADEVVVPQTAAVGQVSFR